jgi:hypothetical protein
MISWHCLDSLRKTTKVSIRTATLGQDFFFYYWWGGTKSLGTVATYGLLYKPQMIDEDDCGAIGGMKIGRGNRSTLRKPAPAPFCPPQIPHDQTWAQTPGRRSGKPATNCMSYGPAFWTKTWTQNTQIRSRSGTQFDDIVLRHCVEVVKVPHCLSLYKDLLLFFLMCCLFST